MYLVLRVTQSVTYLHRHFEVQIKRNVESSFWAIQKRDFLKWSQRKIFAICPLMKLIFLLRILVAPLLGWSELMVNWSISERICGPSLRYFDFSES